MPKVLIVEDHSMSLSMMARRLVREGHTVVTATNGKEAIEAARTHAPDLILMDLTMPEMDGWEATRLIKSDAALKEISIVALTARAAVDDVVRARSAGFDGYETKPVDFRRLLKKIGSLTGEQPAEAQPESASSDATPA